MTAPWTREPLFSLRTSSEEQSKLRAEIKAGQQLVKKLNRRQRYTQLAKKLNRLRPYNSNRGIPDTLIREPSPAQLSSQLPNHHLEVQGDRETRGLFQLSSGPDHTSRAAGRSEAIVLEPELHSSATDGLDHLFSRNQDPGVRYDAERFEIGSGYDNQRQAFVDSAYGTASHGQVSDIKAPMPVELVSIPTVNNDSRTEYSDPSVADSQIDSYMARLADDLYAVAINLQPDSQHINTISDKLPEMLQQFAQRISSEVRTNQGREVTYYVHRHRKRIAELFKQRAANENNIYEDSASTVSTGVPYEEKVQNWLTQADSEMDVTSESQYDPDFILEQEPAVYQYNTFVAQTSAYHWLVANISRELTLSSEDDGMLTTLRRKIQACLPPLPKMSIRGPPELLKLLYKVEWDPMAFVNQQAYSELPLVALERAITLTGLPNDAQALPCFQYLKQVWPISSVNIIRLLKKIMCMDVDQKVQVKSNDSGDLTAWRSPPFFYLEASGSRSGITEVGEQLAWLGAALRSTPYTGCANCRPYIDDSDLITEERSELEFADSKTELKSLNIQFALDQYGLGKEGSEGQCWQNLFRNPTLVRGFPIMRKDNHQQGLEMPLNMLAGLVGTIRAHLFSEVVFIKGFSMMAVPSDRANNLLMWHIFFDPAGGHISYLQHTLPPIEGVGLSNLHTMRHIVGWCAQAQSYAGRPEANYRIGKPRLSTLGIGSALEKATISGGMFVNMGFSFIIGTKDTPLHISRKPYVSKLRQMSKTYFVFWDTDEKRGWLVNGVSALLHLLRASLEHYSTDPFRFALLSQPTDILEPSTGSDKEYPIRILLDEHNRALPLYLDKEEEYTEQGPSSSKIPFSLTKRRKTYHKLEHRVEELYEILEKIVAYQVEITGKAGVNMKAHARKRLEGWNFKDLASDLDPAYPRFATLHACGKGWVDFTRSIHAVTLFGKEFGELIKSTSNIECSRWTSVPKDRYYLTALVSDLRQIMEEEGDETVSPMQLCNGISWFNFGTSFDDCECTKSCGSTHTDFVQTLWPTSLRKVLPSRAHSPLHDDGAVIFGHNITFKWTWPDKGDPIRRDPVLEPNVSDTEEYFHDSGIVTTENEGSNQTSSILSNNNIYDKLIPHQLQPAELACAEPKISSTELAVSTAIRTNIYAQTDTLKHAGETSKSSRLKRASKYLPWSSSRAK